MQNMQQFVDGTHIAEMSAFLAVAEEGSFTKAAAKLGRDATALSRRIQALERRLGVRLLERTTRHVVPTEAGSMFLARTRSILAALAEAEEEASAHASDTPRGTLRLALPGSFGRMWIAPVLPEFLAAHPQVRIEAEFSNRFTDLIGEGFDAAIRLGALPDSGLIARKIATRQRLLCAAPRYLERHGVPAHPEELAAHACLGFTGFVSYPDWHFTNDKDERVTIRARGPLVTDDAEALVAAAVQGTGIMMCTDWLAGRELAEGRLVPILSEWTMADEGAIYTLVPSKHLLAAKTRAFVDWMATRFAPVPPWRQWQENVS
jgi:DNA-binding transcriptional LysR family regulator